MLRLMRTHRAAGTILCPIGSAGDYDGLQDQIGGMALVTVDHRLPGARFDSVMLDNRAAARLATQAIVEHGHRRIGTIAGPLHLEQAAARLDGFKDVLGSAGITVDPALVLEAGFREADAFAATTGLLANAEPPTALFVANNQMLIGVMRALAAAGLHCPADMSITAIDDFPWAAAFTPALTTVRQPVETMAEMALTMVLDRITGSAKPAEAAVLAPELAIRGSCAPPRRTHGKRSAGNLDKSFGAPP
jgi:LacI family transcriptional regulator